MRPRRQSAAVCASLWFSCACGAPQQRAAQPTAVATNGAIDVPAQPSRAPWPRQVVARSLSNPRGMLVEADGSLLVSIAGTGDPATADSGALLRLRDGNADGDFDDAGERETLLGAQPSRNLLHIVRRDEVFGMAGMAAGEGTALVALAFFGGPSTVFRVDGGAVTRWGGAHGNLNDLAYDPRRKAWYAVASTSDEVVRLIPGGRAERVAKLPALASGQDAVPGYLLADPMTGELLVSLFSGSPEGEEGGEGTELVPRSASIVRVHPDTRAVAPVVTSLTVPTDLEVAADGSIYVLELCDAFLDPVRARAELQAGARHGGFRRFSGRLLRIDRHRGEVAVVAEGLDAPTNLALSGHDLYIAEGMGTPGRLIPGPDGVARPLEGFIERLVIP